MVGELRPSKPPCVRLICLSSVNLESCRTACISNARSYFHCRKLMGTSKSNHSLNTHLGRKVHSQNVVCDAIV